MHLHKKYLLLLISILVINSSCIDDYYPNIGKQDSDKITILGQITDVEGYQTVSISTSSSIEKPQNLPVTGCMVIILDDKGNSFKLDEYKDGQYRVWITKNFLIPGTSYGLKVTTKDGEEIESDFDQMQACPEIDSVYYIRENVPTSNPDKPLQGVQFYIDMDATNVTSHYYKWEIEETWEHHATYPKLWFWDGKRITKLANYDLSMMVCWSTKKLESVYTFSTENLAQNKVKMHPLHFVDNLTQRLTYCYSILVTQYSLSPAVYNYWEQQRVNNNLGGLYGKQPISIKGNIRNVTSPEKKVLGIFQATSKKSKRIFVMNVKDLDLYYNPCEPGDPEEYLFPKGMIVYLYQYTDGRLWILDDACVECFNPPGTVIHSPYASTTKPSFWPY